MFLASVLCLKNFEIVLALLRGSRSYWSQSTARQICPTEEMKVTDRMRASFGRATVGALAALVTLTLVLLVMGQQRSHAQAGDPPPANAFHLPPTFDLDGDGAVDLIQTRAAYNRTDPSLGAVDVFSLSTLQRLVTFGNSGELDVFGIAAAPAGDIDGDGRDDIVIGAPHALPNGTHAGQIHIYSGATHALIRTITGPHPSALMGRAVAGAGDVNGDGVPDIAASGFIPDANRNSIGQVYVFSGTDGAHLRTYTASWIDDGFGFRIESLGDVDGDGMAELAIAATLSPGNVGTQASGQLLVFNGVPDNLHFELTAADANQTIYCDEPDVFSFAALVQRVGDVNADGRDDLLVGSAFDPVAPGGIALIDTIDMVGFMVCR